MRSRRNSVLWLGEGIVLVVALVGWLAARTASGCACGCGVFEVGTPSLFPLGSGGLVYVRYDFLDQSENWSGTSRAPAEDNPDKRIKTGFYTAGLHYMFDRSWGVQVEVPYWDRTFRTTADDGSTVTFHHRALGDVRLMGVYSGFSADMSTGVLVGLKLPTGDYTYDGFDRDTEIGSGSTDLLLGAYHMGRLSASGAWNWFADANWDHPFRTRGGYEPGEEVDAAAGIYVNAGSFGGGSRIAPLARVIGSHRARDAGPAANPDDSGYARLLLSPGIELDFRSVTVLIDAGFPVYQRVNGNQLIAPRQYTLTISHRF